MGRSPCCDESGLKKGPWTPEEDDKLIKHIHKHGHGSWRALPKLAGIYIYISLSLSLTFNDNFVSLKRVSSLRVRRKRLLLKVNWSDFNIFAFFVCVSFMSLNVVCDFCFIFAGLNRCGKSCRLRWTNYLRPDIKRGKFSEEEEQTILHLHSILGNK